ncbi:hotdog fold domain-containing protein [Silanimonas algicola]
MSTTTPLLALYRRFERLPLGRWLFSRAVCLKAPYFGTIRPTITRLEPGHCEARIPHRRGMQNHIGSVHAIALCNLAELCAGVMTDASIPADMRWIPKGMTVQYLKKAMGPQTGIARPRDPVVSASSGYELPVQVEVHDASGEPTFRAEVVMWLSPKPARTA